jgi:hypothetical protein
MRFEGTPSDRLTDVLATGRGDARLAFISLSARDPDGRDAEYLEWHALDHRPEQYRLTGLRGSLRLVSTPACRAARAASAEAFDAVDHVMTYLFDAAEAITPFLALGKALHEGGRMPHRLPSVSNMIAEVAGKHAAPRILAGADVLPWRPAIGAYLLIEKGQASAEALVDTPGVAGAWWFAGGAGPAAARSGATQFPPNGQDSTGLQFTYCYLDDDPVAVAGRLADKVRVRWASGAVQGLLAAPFFTAVPYDWRRSLPG